MKLYLNTEISARELDGNLALAVRAAKEGFRSLIFDQRDLFWLEKYFISGPGVFHTKSMHKNKAMVEAHKRLVEKNLHLTSIDQEGGVLRGDYENYAKTRYASENLELATKVFCWGDSDLRFLKDNFPSLESKFEPVGLPRADLWKPAGRAIGTIDTGSFAIENYVLISSNFSINSFYRYWEALEGYSHLWSADNRSELRRQFFLEKADGFRLMLEYLELFEKLSVRFPETTFVVRPHPTETVDAWTSLLSEHRNFRVIREGALSSWVQHAQALIQTGCTSVVEAEFATVPAITFLPFDLSSKALDRALEFGERCTSSSEVEKALKRIQNNHVTGQPGRIPTTALGALFSNYSGKSAVESMVLAWKSLLKPRVIPRGVPFRWRLAGIAGFAKLGLVKLSSRKSTKVMLEKFPSVNKDVTSRKVVALAELYGNRESVSVSFLGPRLICVSPR